MLLNLPLELIDRWPLATNSDKQCGWCWFFSESYTGE